MSYGCYPYIMRFNRYEESPFRGIYITLARWCNQPSMFNKKSFAEFCATRSDSDKYLKNFVESNPQFIKDYSHFLYMKYKMEEKV